jgi:uncharacterized membrane protein
LRIAATNSQQGVDDMTRSVKTIIITIGALSVLSGIYLAFTGSEFAEYFSGIFLGVVLIGSALFYSENPDPK